METLETIEVFCNVPLYFDVHMIERIEENLLRKSNYMCQQMVFSYNFDNTVEEKYTFTLDIPSFYDEKEYQGISSKLIYDSLHSDYNSYCLTEALELENREELAIILNRIALKFKSIVPLDAKQSAFQRKLIFYPHASPEIQRFVKGHLFAIDIHEYFG